MAKTKALMNNRNTTQEDNVRAFTEALINKTNDILYDYYNNNAGKQPKHVAIDEVAKIFTICVAIGTAIGTVVPVAGNAIGAGIGAVTTAAISGIIEATHLPENKKITNANKVVSFINSEQLIADIAQKITEELRETLNQLQATPDNTNSFAEYFARQLFTAIKSPACQHAREEDGPRKINAVMRELKHANSKKAHSTDLVRKDGESIQTKTVFKCLS